MGNTNLLNLNDLELFKEDDKLYLLIDGVKWFFADEILKDIPEPRVEPILTHKSTAIINLLSNIMMATVF